MNTTVTVKRRHPVLQGLAYLLLFEVRLLVLVFRVLVPVVLLLAKGAVYTVLALVGAVQQFREDRARRKIC